MSTHLDNHIRPLYQEIISALDYINNLKKDLSYEQNENNWNGRLVSK